ncbi:MAG TPA: hypothetical protein VFF67_03880 [Thermoplasmata archaeon]|nr:hypothetical protein [Thermoplasmata archaeon]
MEDRPPEPTVPVEKLLRDLRGGDESVEVVARVVTAERREITRRSDGGRRSLLSGLLSDGTATVRFTWWDPPKTTLERGTVLRVVNARVREFRGRPELSFDWRSRVGEASDAELPRPGATGSPAKRVNELADRDEGFSIAGRVVRVAPKNVTVREERRVVHEGVLADASGAIAFSSWTDFGLQAGEAIRIQGGYVSSFRHRPQLVLDERTNVERIEGGDLPAAEALSAPPPTTLSALDRARGGLGVAARGVVVAILPPSGLIYRCPTCRRTTQQGLCRTHGKVNGEPDLRARLVLDDGTSTATVEVGRAGTERLLGSTLDQVLEELRAQPDPGRIEEKLFEATFGTRWEVRGDAQRDDFGLTIYPTELKELTAAEPSGLSEVERALAELRT